MGANLGIVVGVLFNMYLWLYVPEVFWFWWNAIGCLVTIIVAVIASNLIQQKVNKGLEVVYYPGRRELWILFGFFVLIVLLSIGLPRIFS